MTPHVHYGTPFISGKDSLNNEYLGTDGQRHAIPPTLLISSIGVIEDLSKTVTMDLKQAGNPVYLVGDLTLAWLAVTFPWSAGSISPDGVPGRLPRLRMFTSALFEAIQAGFVLCLSRPE